jgi:hypothetical protein
VSVSMPPPLCRHLPAFFNLQRIDLAGLAPPPG